MGNTSFIFKHNLSMSIRTDITKPTTTLPHPSPLVITKGTPPTLPQVYHIVLPLVLRAGQILVARQKEVLPLAPDARIAHAKTITKEVAELFRTTIPQILSGHVVYEAGEAVPMAEWRWILNPLEGERAYAQGLSRYACSVALQHRGEISIAIVLEPATELAAHAIKGEGAFLNRTAMHVTETKSLDKALVTVTTPDQLTAANKKSYIELITALLNAEANLQHDGTRLLSLLQLADGALDAVAIYPETGAVSRLAAGLFIAKEAGAIVSDGDGKPLSSSSDMILAAPSTVAKAILLAMRSAKKNV